jgi:hypothetical protein
LAGDGFFFPLDMAQSGQTGAHSFDIIPGRHSAYAASAFLKRFCELIKGVADGGPQPRSDNDNSPVILHRKFSESKTFLHNAHPISEIPMAFMDQP